MGLAQRSTIRVSLRFYGELSAFLPRAKRQTTIALTLKERDSVKDVIEAQGAPHTEVDVVIVNGEPVDFSYRVQDGDRIAVYPLFRSLDLDGVRRAGPPPPAEPRFVLDQHLGTLASLLRMLGFDVLYRNDYDDETLARISDKEERVLLTRDRGLLKRSIVRYGCYVWETDPERQLTEVLQRLNLSGAIAPFRRCLRCNGLLEPVDKRDVLERLEPRTREYYHEFAICRACDRVYWKGSHHERMQDRLGRLLDGGQAPLTGPAEGVRLEERDAARGASRDRSMAITNTSDNTTDAAGTTATAVLSPTHAAQLGGYDAARAAHIFEEFLEMRLSHDAFWEWLMCYPPHYGLEPADPGVEDEINHATLALLGFQHGTRTWQQVAAELRDARARLTGLARQ